MTSAIAPVIATAVLTAAADHHAVTVAALRSPSHRPDLVRARASAAYLLRSLTNAPLTDIGVELARKHQSVIRLLAKIEQERSADAALAAWLDQTAETIAKTVGQPPPSITGLPLFGGVK